MSDWGFEWDPRKAAANRRRHRLAFEAAVDAFQDEHGLRVPDEVHSDEEQRTVLIARIGGGLVVTVVYTLRGDSIRIISARPASAQERRDYYGDE